jgi:Ca2+-binding RTX toxin-like protein
MIESFESRRLLSASLEGGVLTVTGTDATDRVNIGSRGGEIIVRQGATFARFAAAAVDRIVVDAGGGHDLVSLQPALTKPATLNGGAGNDRLTGGGGDDALNGGDGNDGLSGGEGDDALDGGEGDDHLDGGGGADAISGGAGRDGVNYSRRTAALNVSLDGNADDGAAGEGDNVAEDVERVHGGSGDDTLTGSSASNILAGGAGNDTISGGGGGDALDGGPGDDTISGDAGDDRANGGDGNDTLNGGGGNDSLNGGAGDDTLNGGDDNDWLVGGAGSDRLNGGAGNDRLVAADTSADILDGGDGTDAAMTDSLDTDVSNVETRRTPRTTTPGPRTRPEAPTGTR